MESVVFRIFLFSVVFSFTACEKENTPVEVTLPEEVAFGTSEVYLNGTHMPAYQNQFSYNSGSKNNGFSFYEDLRPGFSNSVSFGWMPLREGRYPIGKPGVLHEIATANFSQVINEDEFGYKYTLIEPENGYFHITHLDTINKEVKGHFKAKFRRAKKNGYKDGNLPKILLYQGIFYDNYTHY